MKIVKCLLAALVSFCVVASLALNVFLCIKTQSLSEAINDLSNEYLGIYDSEDVAQEDDVTIAGEYVIRSTLEISDAYISGDSSKLNDKQKETLDMASAVLDEITEAGMSDYEKELAVYEWMTSSLSYDDGAMLVIPDTTADCDNPYGVLKYHNAVCVGYATTFRLFMQMMNIECMVVHDTYLSHSWDLVKLDGEWYHTDIYMDSGNVSYTNFNMNDELCAISHNWNTDFFPSADGIKYNYAYSNKTEAEDILSLPSIVKEIVDEKKSTAVAVTFKEAVTEENQPYASYITDRLENTVGSYLSGDVYTSFNWIVDDNGEYILFIFVESYIENSDSSYSELDTDMTDKIDEAIVDVFGFVASDYYYEDDFSYSEEVYDDSFTNYYAN